MGERKKARRTKRWGGEKATVERKGESQQYKDMPQYYTYMYI
jgi:hypothetical protein